jgi:hypothetical protein
MRSTRLPTRAAIQLAVVVTIIVPTILSEEEFSAADLKELRTIDWELQSEVDNKWKRNQCPN